MLFGILMGLSASASWAAANVCIQRASRAVGPFRALVWAQVVGGIAVAPVAALIDHRAGHFDATAIAWAVVAAVAAVVAYACLFFSSERGRLSVVVPVMSSWSVVAATLSLVVLGETVRRIQLAGSALVVAGVLIVSRFSQTGGPAAAASGARARERGALLAAVATALGFGVLVPAIDRLAPIVGRVGAIPLVFLCDLAIGIPVALAARVDLRPPPRAAWAAVAGAGVFETVGFVWISLGASSAPVSVVTPLAGLSSAFTVLFAWLWLREQPPRMVLVGAAVACAGVVVLAV